MIAPARIRTSRGGTFVFDSAGAVAAIGKVHDRDGVLADLVTWLPGRPGTWWLRRGTETPVLGARDLAVAAWFHEPIRLYSTPESWFLSGQDGVCVLMWSASMIDLFDGVAEVVVADPTFKRKLTRAWRSWEPRVVVDVDGRRRRTHQEVRDAA